MKLFVALVLWAVSFGPGFGASDRPAIDVIIGASDKAAAKAREFPSAIRIPQSEERWDALVEQENSVVVSTTYGDLHVYGVVLNRPVILQIRYADPMCWVQSRPRGAFSCETATCKDAQDDVTKRAIIEYCKSCADETVRVALGESPEASKYAERERIILVDRSGDYGCFSCQLKGWGYRFTSLRPDHKVLIIVAGRDRQIRPGVDSGLLALVDEPNNLFKPEKVVRRPECSFMSD